MGVSPRVRWKPTVLLYHGFSVGPRVDDPYGLVVSENSLRAQLVYLRTHRWTPLDLDEYLRALDSRGRTERSFLVTIDDALQSVADVGAPLLAEAAVPSVLFAPCGLLGGRTAWLDEQPNEPILSAGTLSGLQSLGVEIGVHGWDHASMADMSDADLRRNTVEARDAIADVTGSAPRAFAYPYGDYDDRTIDAVARAGYTVAFSVYSDRGRHAISRSDVKPGDSLTAFRCKLIPRYRAIWRAAGVAKPVRRLLRVGAQHIGTQEA